MFNKTFHLYKSEGKVILKCLNIGIIRKLGLKKISVENHLKNSCNKDSLINSRSIHNENNLSRKKTFDYIIIGAGSAGCVLANRLSVDNNYTVNLLEAGPSNNDRSIQMPLGMGDILSSDKFNWNYHTKPQKYLNNRILYYPRGKVLGGCSSINATLFVRGHPYDFERWVNEGASGWSYGSCLPYFRIAETYELGENLYRGCKGPVRVNRSKMKHILNETWIKAGIEAGYCYNSDFNGYKQEGFGNFDLTIHQGVRWSTSKAYLEPVLERKNLKVTTSCLVTKILFNGTKAIGVEILNKEGQLQRIIAHKEVILSAGAINSPQLLMLSGIGNGNELKKHSIDVIENIPGVGQNLQDHASLSVHYECTKSITLFSLQLKDFKKTVDEEWDAHKTGLGSCVHFSSGNFIRSNKDLLHPDLQFCFNPNLFLDHGRQFPTSHSFQVIIKQLKSKSKGSISLKSNDPRQHPIIDPNFCSLDQDMWEMRTAIKLCREILHQKAFDEFRGDEISPGIDVQNDKQMNEFIRDKCEHVYHSTSTCKMGSTKDNSTVVDSQCQVVGVDNLRVVDASVMPSITSGNTNAPTIMIAEKVADMILGKKPLPKLINVPIWNPVNSDKQREADQ